MISSWILLLVSIGYAALLFGVAWWGDRRPMYPDRPWLRPVVYSLALAVYCSSWTFYGAVGSAVRNGIGYLPIYLGPLLLLLFGWRIIERLALIARSQNTVSIADFISSRYGRSRRLVEAGRQLQRRAETGVLEGAHDRVAGAPEDGVQHEQQDVRGLRQHQPARLEEGRGEGAMPLHHAEHRIHDAIVHARHAAHLRLEGLQRFPEGNEHEAGLHADHPRHGAAQHEGLGLEALLCGALHVRGLRCVLQLFVGLRRIGLGIGDEAEHERRRERPGLRGEVADP